MFDEKLKSGDLMNTTSALLDKRIETFAYIKRLHLQDTHYFKTLGFSSSSAPAAFPSSRTPLSPSTNALPGGAGNARCYFILGTSIANYVDASVSAPELLRQLNMVLSEYEAAFKNKRVFSLSTAIRRRATETGSTHLTLIHTAFDLDLHQTLATLCDVFIAAYTKLLPLGGQEVQQSSPDLELFTKVDGRMKRLVLLDLIQEMDEKTRTGIASELNNLEILIDDFTLPYVV